ncbi:hypothetical protein VYU27_007902 [Nannochloropsis oceanica]
MAARMLAKWSSKAEGQATTASPTPKQEVSSPVLSNLEGQSNALSPGITNATASKGAGKLTMTASVSAYKAPVPFLIESLAWQDLSYYYRTQDGGKDIEKAAVKNATGLVRRGDMVAVMGPSGAGKSSLFDVLARRIGSSGRLEGQMYVNGSALDDDTFQRISEYVQHEDVFVPTQTLENALLYHCNLRLGPTVPLGEKRAKVEGLAHEAGLSDKMHTRIGGLLAGGLTVKGLSNGEKRRASVVCAALASPSILFLDEPTSGLDSYAALKVMEMMSKFCAEGRLIVCTIHQPRSQVYDLFNKVLVLSQGNTIYFGDSSTAGVLRWFEGTLQRSLPLGTSIPDFVLDLVNISFLEDEDGKEGGMERGEEEGKKPKNGLASTGEQHGLSSSEKSIKRKENKKEKKQEGMTQHKQHKQQQQQGPLQIIKAAALFRHSPSSMALREEINEIHARALSIEKDHRHKHHGEDERTDRHVLTTKEKIIAATHRGESSWAYRFQVVFKRNLQFYLANPGNVLVRLFISFTVGIFQGIVFFNSPSKTPALVQAVALLICLFVTQLQALLLPFVSMTLFIEDRKFFVREAASRLYSTSIYFLANALLELILTTACALIYGLLTYFLCFYATSGDFAFSWARLSVYLLFVVAGAHTGSMQAIMCAILSPSLELACTLNVGITCVFCFGGIPPRLLFPPARIIQWISPLKYSYTAMVESYFRGTSANFYVEMMDVTRPSGVWVNFGCLLVFFIVYNVISFWGLHNLYRTKR